jgi:polysaccharide biosynthesis/export protein
MGSKAHLPQMLSKLVHRLRRSMSWWAALGALTLASPSVTAQAEYVIGVQDGIAVQVWNRPELSGKFTVDVDGTIQLPLIELLKVAGLTVRAVEANIRARLADGYLRDPQVTVTVETYRSQRAVVQGEVRQPGTVTLTGETPLLEVLTRVGSVTPEAGGEVIIVRKSQRRADGATTGNLAAPETHRLDLTAIQNGTIAPPFLVRDGDTITVARGEHVYVLGHVRVPGAYQVRTGSTLLQALALAGGVTDRGTTRRIKIRRMVSGKPKEISASVDQIVLPGDTIVVPERYF